MQHLGPSSDQVFATPVSFAAILIGLSAIVLPSWLVLAADRNPPLEVLAEQSCRCARLEHDVKGKARCWDDFEKASAMIGGTETASVHETCAGLVAVTRCFSSGQCVVTGYRAYLPPIREGQFCTAGEAAHAEALGNRYADDAAAESALKQLSARFAAGDRPNTPRVPLRGCGG